LSKNKGREGRVTSPVASVSTLGSPDAMTSFDPLFATCHAFYDSYNKELRDKLAAEQTKVRIQRLTSLFRSTWYRFMGKQAGKVNVQYLAINTMTGTCLQQLGSFMPTDQISVAIGWAELGVPRSFTESDATTAEDMFKFAEAYTESFLVGDETADILFLRASQNHFPVTGSFRDAYVNTKLMDSKDLARLTKVEEFMKKVIKEGLL
jgi:hypothetical protein